MWCVVVFAPGVVARLLFVVVHVVVILVSIFVVEHVIHLFCGYGRLSLIQRSLGVFITVCFSLSLANVINTMRIVIIIGAYDGKVDVR